jgi:Kef-type K+ transport system membrane component KefB
MSWREAGAIGVLMNTRGLVELVILNIGLEIGAIPPVLFSMMVLMALVTTFMTSPLLSLIYSPGLSGQGTVNPGVLLGNGADVVVQKRDKFSAH